MTLFRTHNLLPALGGTALVCAYGITRCGEWLIRRVGEARAPVAAFLLCLLPVGLLVAQPFAYTYRQVVPSTWVDADRALLARLAPMQSRHVIYEPVTAQLRLSATWRLPLKTAVPSLAALSPSQLDLTDAEVLPLSRLQGPAADFYRSREQTLARENIVEIHARPFRSRGAPLLLLLHPWTPAGDAVPIQLERSGDSPGVLAARLPAGLAAGDVVSFELMRPGAKEPDRLLLLPGGQSVPFYYAGHRHQKKRFLTQRFQYAAGVAEIRIPVDADPRICRLQLWRWTQAKKPGISIPGADEG
jgi:hypothetical protein